MLYISMNTSSISFEKDRYLSTVSHERVMLSLLWQHRFLVIWHLSPFKLIMEEAKRPRCALCLIIWNWYQSPVSYATWCCHTRLQMSDNLIVPLTCLTVNQRSSCAKVTRQCIKYLPWCILVLATTSWQTHRYTLTKSAPVSDYILEGDSAG